MFISIVLQNESVLTLLILFYEIESNVKITKTFILQVEELKIWLQETMSLLIGDLEKLLSY